MLVTGDLTAGTILTVLFAVIIGAFSLGSMGPRIEAFAKASAATQKIFQTLQRIPTIDSLDEGGRTFEGVRGEIDLKGVSFIYPSRPEGIFSRIIFSPLTSHLPFRLYNYQFPFPSSLH